MNIATRRALAGSGTVLSTLLGICFHASGQVGQTEKAAPTPPSVLPSTQAEIDAIRASFLAQPDAPSLKVLAEPPPKPERKFARWDGPRPEVPADLRNEDLHTYYLYMGKPITMVVDTTRVAVKFAGLAPHGGEDKVIAAANALGVPVKDFTSPGVANWRFLNFAAPLHGKHAVDAVIQALLTDPAFEFVSPMYDHPTITGGYVVITPEINVRVREARVVDADDVLTAAVPMMPIVTRDLGELPGAYQIRGTERNGFKVLRAANLLAENPAIAWAEPDMLSTMKLDFVPNDEFWGFASMWGWEQNSDIDTDAETAWDLTRGRSTIRVLVMDVGVEQNHPDINQIAGRDFTTGVVGGAPGGGPVGNCDRHGTSVAGIISGRINNSIGGAGVCPNCRTASARTAVEDSSPCASTYASFSSSWLANALAWGLGQGCQISNSSFGVGSSATITNAYDNAETNGMLHFVSSGNGGADNIGDPTLGYPSSLGSVQAVTAIDSDGGRSNFANWGTGLQFACPGTNVRSCDRQDALGYTSSDYAIFSGTSAASPFCAGVAALTMSAYPNLSPASILVRMRTSCRDLGTVGYDTGYGWGFPNADSALRLFSSNDWCDTATNITSFAYNPSTFSTGGFNEVPDELQENCESGDVGVSHSVWYSFVPPCAGTLDINTNGSTYDTVLSVFRGTCASAFQVGCDDDSGTDTQSQIADLQVLGGFTYLIKVSAYGPNNAGGTLNFNFLYTPTAPNNSCSSATAIPSAPYVGTVCSVGATTQTCEVSGSCVSASVGSNHSVWWSFTPTKNGRADINTNGSDYDTVLSVWGGCPTAIFFDGNIICLSNGGQTACDDDSGAGSASAVSGVVLRRDVTYRIRVAAYNDTTGIGGHTVLSLAYHPCPQDFNGDGFVTVQDIFAFLTAWFAGDSAADYTMGGLVNVSDIFAFLTDWFAGC